jgi:hypothetical protein
MQYGRSAMRANRQQLATRALLVLALLLASVWTGSHAGAVAGQPFGHLTAGRPLQGVEPADLRDRLPAVRPPVDRSGQSGRLVPLLLGALAAALAVAHGRSARRLRSGWARARSLVRRTRLEPRAPPPLQPA